MLRLGNNETSLRLTVTLRHQTEAHMLPANGEILDLITAQILAVARRGKCVSPAEFCLFAILGN